MDELVVRQTVHDTVLTEYGNNELHPEVMPGTVLPTFYNMHTISDVPTVDQINIFNIPERYHYYLIFSNR